jgi:MFS family permease
VPATGAPGGGLDRAGRRRVTATLCLTEVTSWGVLFYAFPVLQQDIAADTGWATVPVAAAFTLGQVIAALAGIGVGRVLDRHGPRWLMTGGSVLAVLSMLVVASATSLAGFLAGWVLAGLAMSAVLYPPAFAALTRWHDHSDRLRALTLLTVAGGLASTVFAPVIATLAGAVGWRDTYLLLAGLLALVTVPLHAWGLRGPWPAVAEHTVEHTARPVVEDVADDLAVAGPTTEPAAATGPGLPVGRSPRLGVTAVVFALAGLAAYAVVINLVPLLRERGASLTTAGLLLGLGGLGQVVGRVGFLSLAGRSSLRTRTLVTVAAMAATTALLGVLTGLLLLAALIVVAGIARGMFTLLQATAVTDRWGTHHYGRLTGLLAAPTMLAVAMAPWFGAWLAQQLGSYSAAFLVLAALGGVSVLLVPATLVPHPRER